MAEADSRRLTTACTLDLMRVQTSDGRTLGHIFDVRCESGSDKPPTVTAIVYGERGLLERLGLRRERPTVVPWSRVRSIGERAVVVDDAADAGGTKR
ncbi:MAG TPA: PRC-barrel domain-containing protein [Caldimonas sp.]|nr:PRC-barrel domain-containing protein [Caldimonas sp.]